MYVDKKNSYYILYKFILNDYISSVILIRWTTKTYRYVLSSLWYEHVCITISHHGLVKPFKFQPNTNFNNVCSINIHYVFNRLCLLTGYEWNIMSMKIHSRNVYRFILLKTNAQVSNCITQVFQNNLVICKNHWYIHFWILKQIIFAINSQGKVKYYLNNSLKK